MFSIRMATDVDTKIINSKTGIRCMARFLREKRKQTMMGIVNNDGLVERYKAVRNGYEIKYDINQG